VIRVYDEAGKVIEITRRLRLGPLRGNQLAFRGRECQNDRALVVAMCAQSVRLLFRAQCSNWVHVHGATRRKKTGEQRSQS